MADDVCAHADRARLHQAFSRWRASCGARQTSLLQAELVHEQSIVGHTLKAWVAKARRSRQDEVTANKARVFFVQRQVVRCWRLALAGRKQAEAVERRRLLDLGRVFNRESVPNRSGSLYADNRRMADRDCPFDRGQAGGAVVSRHTGKGGPERRFKVLRCRG
jgi:hypothetical protein